MPSVLDLHIAANDAIRIATVSQGDDARRLSEIGLWTTDRRLREWRLETGYPTPEIEELFRQDFSERLAPAFRRGAFAGEPRVQTVAQERARRVEMRRFRDAAPGGEPERHITRTEARRLVQAHRRVIKVIEDAQGEVAPFLPPLPANDHGSLLPVLDINGKPVATPKPAQAPKPTPAQIPMERLSPETLPLFPELAPAPKRRTARNR